jgi:hypothetical protein
MATSCLGRQAVFSGDPSEPGLSWFIVNAVRGGADVKQPVIDRGDQIVFQSGWSEEPKHLRCA